MISGFRPKEIIAPASPTAAERRNPVFDRSIRYHKRGLAIAKVRETCIVEAHGIFLCKFISTAHFRMKEPWGGGGGATNSQWQT